MVVRGKSLFLLNGQISKKWVAAVVMRLENWGKEVHKMSVSQITIRGVKVSYILHNWSVGKQTIVLTPGGQGGLDERDLPMRVSELTMDLDT